MPADHIIHMANGRLAADTPFARVREIVGVAAARPRVVIHMHGGLVSARAAYANAARLKEEYARADAFPIFLNWESHILETIQNNFRELAKEAFFTVVLERVEGIVERKFLQSSTQRGAGVLPSRGLGGAAAVDEPVLRGQASDISQAEALALELELLSDAHFQLVTLGVAQALRAPEEVEAERLAKGRSAAPLQASGATLMDPEVLERLLRRPEAGGRGVLSTLLVARAVIDVARNVLRRYRAGRDHGFHATVVEEVLRAFYLANVGGRLWEAMKGDTRDSVGDDPQVFGGTALLSELGRCLGMGATPVVTLVGHSTGAVMIGHLLEAADAWLPPDFRFDVVLLAPAATFEFANRTLVRQRERIRGLRLFNMCDETERADVLVPFVYPHSLLYFVSGVVEGEANTPVIGMQRFYDPTRYTPYAYEEVERFRAFVRDFDNATVWSVSLGDGPGLDSESRKHGDFDNDPVTLASLRHIIRHGMPIPSEQMEEGA